MNKNIDFNCFKEILATDVNVKIDIDNIKKYVINYLVSPFIFEINKPCHKLSYKIKIASFDYDHTIVEPKEGRTFAKDIDDWQWFNENVPAIIRSFYEKDFVIVIFTNQSKAFKIDQIYNVLKSLNIPLYVCISYKKEDRKPSLKIVKKFLQDSIIDKDLSFYVGDALGRKSDFSDSDKKFAENMGIKFYPPEDIFTKTNVKYDLDLNIQLNLDLNLDPINNKKEVIVMVGYPGSGKSTIAKSIVEKYNNYVYISRDEQKTVKKMLQFAKKAIKDNKSIIFDATNPTIENRKEFTNFARKYNYNTRCIHVDTSFEESYNRNKYRKMDIELGDVKLNKIPYYVYRKKFEKPSIDEDFDLILTV